MIFMAWDSEKNIEKLKALLEGGNGLLAYHHDSDGICSAAIMLKFFPKFRPMPLEGPRLDSSIVKEMLSGKPSVILFLDLPVDQEPEKLEQLKRHSKIAVIDHHIAERDLSRKGMIHMNPKLDKDIYLPTSYMVYKIMEKLGK